MIGRKGQPDRIVRGGRYFARDREPPPLPPRARGVHVLHLTFDQPPTGFIARSLLRGAVLRNRQ